MTGVTLVSLFMILLSIAPGLRFGLCPLKSRNREPKVIPIHSVTLATAVVSLFTLKCGFSQARREPHLLREAHLWPSASGAGPRETSSSEAPSDNLNSPLAQSGTWCLRPSLFSLLLCLLGK